VVFEESTDEGFEHEPAPGDPVTDEAEAPAVPTEVRTAPETLTEPEEEDDTGPEEESDTEPDPTQDSADESPFASWDPPTEDRDEPSVLADYVPRCGPHPRRKLPHPLPNRPPQRPLRSTTTRGRRFAQRFTAWTALPLPRRRTKETAMGPGRGRRRLRFPRSRNCPHKERNHRKSPRHV